MVAMATASCAGATSIHAAPPTRLSAFAARPVASATVQPAAARAPTTQPPIPACVATLTPEAKASQLLMALVPEPAAAGDLVASGKIGGYALTGDQQGDLRAAIAAITPKSKLPLLVSGDEEGGTVQRLRAVLGLLPSAAKMASNGSPTQAGSRFATYAHKMADLGFAMNLGPSLDVGGGSGLASRSFGNDVAKVSAYGNAVIAGVREAGLVPVAKHWPGIGGGTADPHTGASPVASIDQLRTRDLVPFDRAIAAGVPAIMVSHAAIPGLTNGVPASLSKVAITGELRGREHFDGLVVTDSLGMGAVSDQKLGNAEAAVVAIEAGADIALISDPKYVADAHRRLVAAIASGGLPAAQLDRSVARVLLVKGVSGACPP